MTVEAINVLHKLNDQAAELDDHAAELDRVEEQLRGVQMEYDEFMGAFEAGLWQRHVEHGDKFPAEKLREKLGRREMPPDLLGRYVGLMSQRVRLTQRIGSLKKSIEAQRSILSALKEGLVQ